MVLINPQHLHIHQMRTAVKQSMDGLGRQLRRPNVETIVKATLHVDIKQNMNNLNTMHDNIKIINLMSTKQTSQVKCMHILILGLLCCRLEFPINQRRQLVDVTSQPTWNYFEYSCLAIIQSMKQRSGDYSFIDKVNVAYNSQMTAAPPHFILTSEYSH